MAKKLIQNKNNRKIEKYSNQNNICDKTNMIHKTSKEIRNGENFNQ